MNNKVTKYIKEPKKIVLYFMNKGIFKYLPDEKYLKLKYYLEMGEKLDLENPKDYSSKLQWLKLYDRKKEYSNLVDKYESKKYIKNLIGDEYIIPTIGIYNKFDDIDFSKLPNKFVIKTTHGCGGGEICHDKSLLNLKKLKSEINKSLKHNYFYNHREYPYKNVHPRIIVEQLLENNDGSKLIEYNIFCFNGIPKYILVCYGDKRKNRYNDYYDINLNKLNIKIKYMSSSETHKFPKEIHKMIELSKILSKNIPNLRVDFYFANGKIYVGELTFYHWAGFLNFEPKDENLKWGSELELPKRNEQNEKSN